MLIYISWQYVRHGRFPSLRVVTANASGGPVSKQVAIHDSGSQAKAVQAEAVQTEANQTENTLSSEIPAEEKDSPTLAEPPASEQTADSHTEGSA